MDKHRHIAPEPPGPARRHKLRQHAASLATGAVVFLVSIGLMQAARPPAGGDSVAAVRSATPAPQVPSFSGSSGAGATGAGIDDSDPAAAPAAGPPAAARPPSAAAPPATAAPPVAAGTRASPAPLPLPLKPPSPTAAAQIMGLPSVYIHVLNESAREQARLLAPALEKKGIALAGIKVVGAGPRSSDLRYFRPSEKEEAMRVQAALLSLGLPAQRLKSINGFETSAVPRQYELWLVSDFKG
jgi:hypothetical protein